ncbi:hypothetical protein DL767_000293 [Monosporascus sp. MG133]|nr:hypothetical protein DL767_000293 [Monosporascus sp. MG133]
MASRNSAYARKVEEEARKYFRDAAGGSAFEFETVIGGGMAGITLRFLERPGAGGTMTRARAAAAAATPPHSHARRFRRDARGTSIRPHDKLIDFDQARIHTNAEEVDEDDVENYDDSPEGDRNPGIDHNILAVGRLDECRDAVQDADVRPDLDAHLRFLVARCLAAEPLNRPALNELVATCHAAVYTKDSAFYAEEKEGQFETDGYLLLIMQRYLHDADTTQLAGQVDNTMTVATHNSSANGWIIQKFGGTSVGKFPDKIVEDIVRASLASNKIVVVCSARSSGKKVTGTTSRLLEVYKKLRSLCAATSDECTQNALFDEAKGLVLDICNEHVYAVQSFIKNSDIQMKVSKDIEDDCQELIDYVIAAKRFNLEVNARSKDRVHVEAEYVDLSDVMHHDSSDRLTPAFYRNAAAIFRKRLLACEDRVPVVTGFFGTVPGSLMDGDIGRGYTDLCAALIAVGLSAEEMQVWKEVDGIFTADPTKVPTARLLAAITPSEAAELTFYGSEVIHHLTMDQVIKAEPPIPIRIKNVKNPRGNGTIVVPDPVQSPAQQIKRSPPSDPSLRKTPKRPTAVTIKDKIAVINVHSNKRSISHGFFAKVFSILDSHQISVDLISTSEVHVSMAIHAAGASASHFEQVTRELEECGDVSVLCDMAILSLVGAEMKNMIGIAGRMFSTLGEHNVNIEMISQGASEINISCVIDAREATRAMNILHTNLFTFLE